MTFGHRIVDFYLQSSLHVAFSLFSLAQLTFLEFGLEVQIPLSICVFTGTVVAYNSLKYAKLIIGKQVHSFFFKWILVTTGIAGFVFGIYALQLTPREKMLFLFGAIMVAIYPYIRKFGTIKMFWVCFVITYVTSFVILDSAENFKGSFFYPLTKRFLFLCALMIPFEIRDSPFDVLQFQTLPQRLGIYKVKIIGFSCLFLFMGLSVGYDWLYRPFNVSHLPLLLNGFLAVVLFVSIYKVRPQSSPYFTGFWVESFPIIGFLMYKLAITYCC